MRRVVGNETPRPFKRAIADLRAVQACEFGQAALLRYIREGYVVVIPTAIESNKYL